MAFPTITEKHGFFGCGGHRYWDLSSFLLPTDEPVEVEDPGWFQPELTIKSAQPQIEPTTITEEVCGISDDS